MYYINCFFIFSILGHLLELFFYKNTEPGILFGFWTPIYGIGVLVIIFIYNMITKYIKKDNFMRYFVLFLISSIVLATMELCGGYLIKYIFHKELWNYSNHAFSIGKYTSLEMAFIWGICSILFIKIIKPISDKYINKIPNFLTYILIFSFVIDIILTLIIK